MISIRALYAVYIKNIKDAFETGDKLKPPKFHPKIKKRQTLEKQLTNDFETLNEKSGKGSLHDDSTLLKGTSTNDSKLQMTKRGLLEEDKEEENLAETDALKPWEKNPDFKGDENLMTDESRWTLNTWNTLLFAGAIILASLFTGFCCVYTVKFYT